VASLLCRSLSDVKCMVAMSRVSHISVLLGVLCIDNCCTVHIVVLLMIAHGYISGCMFLLAGVLLKHDITRCSYMMHIGMVVAVLLTVSLMMNFGCPPFIGFIIELHCACSLVGCSVLITILVAMLIVTSVLYSVCIVRSVLPVSCCTTHNVDCTYCSMSVVVYTMCSQILFTLLHSDWIG
jgi:NADH-quinone oxidoreductase subunit M